MSYLIFPNQLFEIKYFVEKPTEVYLLEDPVYFGFRQEKMNFNKLKLVLHRASMKYYQSYLESEGIIVHYIDFSDLKKNYKSIKTSTKQLYTFNLTDHYLEKKIRKNFKNITFLDNPNFLVTEKQLDEYYMQNKMKKTIIHGNFYNWVKSEINVLTDTKSHDSENRNPLPNNIKIPVLDAPSTKDKNYVYLKEAIEYVNTNFSNNSGPSTVELKDCWFPVTHSESKKWLLRFIKERLNNFGTYEDAIRKDEGFEYRSLFHSLIAPMLNIGLLVPKQVVEEVMKVKGKYSINNIEGFLRQVIGWREYQRYCYLHYYEAMTKSNVFNNNRKLTNAWYNGTTGIVPVDDAIKDAFKHGYLHHIQRLMIMSNIFNLADIHPDEAYKWFMEFSVDSYDWLMTQNVYSMGMWADGGLSMRKPYISTATYVIGMSNYKKPSKKEIEMNGIDWTETWRSLFYHKITANREIFKKTPYIFQLKSWDKMDKKLQDQLNGISNNFINKMTSK
jgi:deoxyribodipyrimidine photolyase-related protein